MLAPAAGAAEEQQLQIIISQALLEVCPALRDLFSGKEHSTYVVHKNNAKER